MHFGGRDGGDEICEFSLRERGGLCGLSERRMSCRDSVIFTSAFFLGWTKCTIRMRIIEEETICSTCFIKHTANLKTPIIFWKFTIVWSLIFLQALTRRMSRIFHYLLQFECVAFLMKRINGAISNDWLVDIKISPIYGLNKCFLSLCS